MISSERIGSVQLVKLNRNITNALNLALINTLIKTFEKIKHADKICSLVLSSSNDKFFSIGWDIPELFKLNEKDFRHFFRKFHKLCMDLYMFPKPTIAAISGHAVAAGCILAVCCDYRYIADSKKLMGLNNLRNGIPLPILADSILKSVVGNKNARDIVDSGEFYESEKALCKGLVDAMIPLKQLMTESIRKAEKIGSLPQQAFTVIKKNRVETIQQYIQDRLEKNEQDFIDCWFSEGTRKLLKKAIAKF